MPVEGTDILKTCEDNLIFTSCGKGTAEKTVIIREDFLKE